MKNKIINFLKNPIFHLVFSFLLCVFIFIILGLIVTDYPFAIEDENFFIGCRFGFYLCGFLFAIGLFCDCLVSFGIWLHKRSNSNG